MSVAARLGAFVAALALVFGVAFAVGGAVDPVGQDPASAEHRSEDPAETTTVPAEDHEGHP